MDYRLCPLERSGVRVIRVDEGINGIAKLFGRGETGAAQRRTTQNAKPAFHLVEPRAIGWREVQVNVGMHFEPPVALWFMRVQVVQDDVDLSSRIRGYHVVHEVQELATSATSIMASLHCSGGYVESGE